MEEEKLNKSGKISSNGKEKGQGLSRRWVISGILLIVFVVLVGAVYGVNKVVTDSNLCVSCHEMRPEYYTWANSSHSQIKCTDCHLPVNTQQRLLRNLEGFKQVIEHFAGSTKDIVVWQRVSNENCLQCHSKNRVATPSGDLIMSHNLHDKNNVDCISCHSGVVHGRIVERGETAKVQRETWTNSIGKTEAVHQNTQPQMIQCLQCHRAWKLTTKCENCHKKIPTPPSHQPDTWQTEHGKAAWDDVNQCSKCHYEQGLNNTFDKTQVAQYIRSNQFCYNCHLKSKPENHNEGWAHDHALVVTRGQVPYCIVCHDVDKNNDGNAATKGNSTYCNQCHGVFSVNGEVSQPIDWIQ